MPQKEPLFLIRKVLETKTDPTRHQIMCQPGDPNCSPKDGGSSGGTGDPSGPNSYNLQLDADAWAHGVRPPYTLSGLPKLLYLAIFQPDLLAVLIKGNHNGAEEVYVNGALALQAWQVLQTPGIDWNANSAMRNFEREVIAMTSPVGNQPGGNDRDQTGAVKSLNGDNPYNVPSSPGNAVQNNSVYAYRQSGDPFPEGYHLTALSSWQLRQLNIDPWVFIAEHTPSGTDLSAYQVAIDDNGNLYIDGGSKSTTFFVENLVDLPNVGW